MKVPEEGVRGPRFEAEGREVTWEHLEPEPLAWREAPHPPDRPPMRPTWNWFGSCPAARHGRVPFQPGNAMHWVAIVLMVGALGLLALGILVQLVILSDADLNSAGFNPVDLVFGLLIMAVPPLVWVLAFYRGGVRAWASRLFLASHRPVVEIAVGLGTAVAMVLALIPLGLLLEALGVEAENPVLDDLVSRLNWGTIFLIAASAAIGEELLFRGFLQPRVGIVVTNILFGLVHLGYGVVLQVVVPLALGFVFSMLVVKTRSLLPAIVAHFAFNFLVLSIQFMAEDFGWV
jgi:membrane protease YdiL (CAAX protease family)